MKITVGISAILYSLFAAVGAGAQTFASPGVSKMTSAYDPSAGAVVIEEQQKYVDYQVQPAQAQVYQPPGRVYGVADPFSTTGPQTVTAPGYPTYGSPTTAAPYGAAPAAPYGTTTVPPITGYSPGVYAAPGGYADPYACQPYCGPQPSVAAPLGVGASIPRSPYSEIEGRAGDPAEVLQTNLVLPFWQFPNLHWFFDLRGQYDDERAGEGNFGIARRALLSNGLITTVYGFYDIRHTSSNNNFQQAMVGFEVMSLDWEYRVNGYLPFSGAQTTGNNVASLDGSNNIVVRQGLEKAYFGMDAEYGWLLTKLGETNSHEVRAFLGGYWFDTSDPAFPTIAGPRGRLEGRMYDLPLLGAGSRFTYGASYQWDDVRESQWIASVNLRIPFGGGRSRGAGLSPIDRRMMSPLRRDEAIITGGALGAPEQAVVTSTGVVATNVTSATSAADITGGGDIVVVEDTIASASTIELQPGQFVGGQFAVHGQNSGAKATFGTKRTITGTGAAVLQIANNATITGLNIQNATNGNHGIIGGADNTVQPPDADALADGVTGFNISNNTVSVVDDGVPSPDASAIYLEGEVSGRITGNRLLGDGDSLYGFYADDLTGASVVSDNYASGFDSGLAFFQISSGEIRDNTSTGNKVGLATNVLLGGTISGNNVSNNVDAGIAAGVAGGTISGNTASNNQFNGFLFIGMADGTISGNTADNNGDDGFDFRGPVTGGQILLNSASGNGTMADDGIGASGLGDGFYFNSINGASVEIASNTSNGNTGDGFHALMFDDGDFNDNNANDNAGMGYNFPASPPVLPASATGNTGSDNGSANNFPL